MSGDPVLSIIRLPKQLTSAGSVDLKLLPGAGFCLSWKRGPPRPFRKATPGHLTKALYHIVRNCRDP